MSKISAFFDGMRIGVAGSTLVVAGAALAISACAPPPITPQILGSRLSACPGSVVTFFEDDPADAFAPIIPCDVVPPQVLNIRMLPATLAGRTVGERCDWMGGRMATTGASLLCEAVDY